MRPFRFAVQTSNAPDAKTWRERAKKYEDLGYSTLYIPDHFTDQWGPLVALTVAAEATTSLNVGALVLDNDYRHPVVLAKEWATLDLISDGRTEFGLGAGWMKTDYDESGIPYDDPAVRVDRLEESLAVLKGLWRDGTATFEGKHYTIRNAQGHPKPGRPGGPKIVIGGGGKRVLSLAAREADIIGVNPNLKSGAADQETAKSAVADMVDKRIGWVREAADERIDEIDLQMLTFFVNIGGDRKETAEMMGPAMGLTAEQAYDVPLALIGSVAEIIEQLHERRERWGFNYWVVHDPEAEAFAEIVGKLAGS